MSHEAFTCQNRGAFSGDRRRPLQSIENALIIRPAEKRKHSTQLCAGIFRKVLVKRQVYITFFKLLQRHVMLDAPCKHALFPIASGTGLFDFVSERLEKI